MSHPVPLPKLHFAPRAQSRLGLRSERAERGVKAASGTADASALGNGAPRRASRWTGTRVHSLGHMVTWKSCPSSTQCPLLDEDDLATPQHHSMPASWRFLCRASRRVATVRESAAGDVVVQLLPTLAARWCFTRQRHADRSLLDRDQSGRSPPPRFALAEPRSRGLAGALQLVHLAPCPQHLVQPSDLRSARARRLLLSGSSAPTPFSTTLLRPPTRQRASRNGSTTGGDLLLLPSWRAGPAGFWR